MKSMILVGCSFCLLLATACSSSYSREDLYGTWEGVAAQEEGTPLDINPADLQFTFTETGYTYRGTLNYREAGTFEVKAPYLYTTDTINQATTEKTVEIVQFSTDSLHLRMMENGKERLLKLVR